MSTIQRVVMRAAAVLLVSFTVTSTSIVDAVDPLIIIGTSGSKQARRAQWLLSTQVDAVNMGIQPYGVSSWRIPVADVTEPLWRGLGPTTIAEGQIGLTGRAREVTGRVTAIKAHPRFGDRFWVVGTAGGGLWRTEDAGKTWQPAGIRPHSRGIVTPMSSSIGTLAFAPDGCVAYAATGEGTGQALHFAAGGMLTSRGHGLHVAQAWDRTHATLGTDDFDWSGVTVTAILVTGQSCTPGARHDVWIATRPAYSLGDAKRSARANFIGLFHATGTGEGSQLGFSQVLTGPFSDLQVDPINPRCLYAGRIYDEIYSDPLGIYRSLSCTSPAAAVTDSGWPNILRLDVMVDNVRIALAADGTIAYASFAAWRIGERVGVQHSRNIRTCATADQCAWRPATFAQVAASSVAHYCSWNPASASPLDLRMCGYANTLLVHPAAPKTLIAGGIALWRCSPCDQLHPSWTDISYTTPRPSHRISPWNGIHVDQQAMDWGGRRLLVANDGGVWSAEWPDANTLPVWSNHNFGLGVAQMYRGALDPRRSGVVFAGTQDVGTIRRDGKRWRWIQGGDGVGVVVSHEFPDRHWATVHQSVLVRMKGLGNRLALWRTRDAGLTFQRADIGMDVDTEEWLPPLVQCPERKPDVLLFGDSRLWRVEGFFTIPTTRAFETASVPAWQQNSLRGADITTIAFRPGSCSSYAYGDNSGKVLITRDSGGYAPAVPDSGDYGGFDPKRWHTIGDFGRKIGSIAFSPASRTGTDTLYVTISRSPASNVCGKSGYIFKRKLAEKLTGIDKCDWDNVTPSGLSGDAIDQPIYSLAIVPEDPGRRRPEVVLAGSDFGAWFTYTGGSSWCRMSLDHHTPYPTVTDLKVHLLTSQVFAFTFGRGVFRLDDVGKAVCACAQKLGAPAPASCPGRR